MTIRLGKICKTVYIMCFFPVICLLDILCMNLPKSGRSSWEVESLLGFKGELQEYANIFTMAQFIYFTQFGTAGSPHRENILIATSYPCFFFASTALFIFGSCFLCTTYDINVLFLHVLNTVVFVSVTLHVTPTWLSCLFLHLCTLSHTTLLYVIVTVRT